MEVLVLEIWLSLHLYATTLATKTLVQRLFPGLCVGTLHMILWQMRPLIFCWFIACVPIFNVYAMVQCIMDCTGCFSILTYTSKQNILWIEMENIYAKKATGDKTWNAQRHLWLGIGIASQISCLVSCEIVSSSKPIVLCTLTQH
jgi:hypothetical protein